MCEIASTHESLPSRQRARSMPMTGNAIRYACTDIWVTLGWLHSWMRVAVRDRSPDLPRRQPSSATRLHGRGLFIVQGLSRSWGMLPTADGGKVVWAVLDA